MTEEEWWACADPTQMLEFLREKTSDRKLRLFAVASCISLWKLLPTKLCLNAITIAESVVDGLAKKTELKSLRAVFKEKTRHSSRSAGAYHAVFTVARMLQPRAWNAAGMAMERAIYALTINTASGQANPLARATAREGVRKQEFVKYSGLLRCIFGNPFRAISIGRADLTSTVTNLAAAAYEERALPSGDLDIARLAILADAVEEAGCDNQEILGHLRGPGPHVRGCWALDLCLGRS